MYQAFEQKPSTVPSSASKALPIYSVPELVSSCHVSQPKTLPNDFQPRDCDILCGRGRGVWDHSGNRQFKALIVVHAEKYAMARTKMDKGALVASMIDKMREAGVLFVKKDTQTQRWHDIGDYQAREKTSHAIRDHIYKKTCAGTNKKKTTRKTTRKIRFVQDDERGVQQSTVVDALKMQQSPQAYPTLSLSSSPSPAFETFPPLPKQTDICMSPRRVSEESMPCPDLVDSLGPGFLYKGLSFEKSSSHLHTTEWTGRSSASNTILLDATSSFLEEARTVIARAEEVIPNGLEQQETPAALYEEPYLDADDEEMLQWSELFPIAVFDEF